MGSPVAVVAVVAVVASTAWDARERPGALSGCRHHGWWEVVGVHSPRDGMVGLHVRTVSLGVEGGPREWRKRAAVST